MIEFFKNLFGAGQKVDLAKLIADGAVIIDVRTPSEYKSGHLKSSVNIPLNTLSSNLSRLDKNKAIITCCASGMRSASAKSMLKSSGFIEVHNGGSWASLSKYEH
jgi:phage shock protein E